MIRTFLGFIVFISFLYINQSPCCGCTCEASHVQGAGVSGPIITMPAYTIPKGKTIVNLSTTYMNNGALNMAQRHQINASSHDDGHGHGDHHHGIYSHGFLRPTAGIGYGLTDDLSIFATLPYSMNFNLSEVHQGGTHDLGNSIGFGDMTFMAQYKFLSLEKLRFDAAVIAGLIMPTGNADVRNNQGELFGANEQPGDGSFDQIAGLALSKQFNDFSLHSSFMYTLANEGKFNTDIGDIFSYNFAITHPIHHGGNTDLDVGCEINQKQEKTFLEKIFPDNVFNTDLAWDLILEANTAWTGDTEVNGNKVDGHGGLITLLSPGLRMIIDNKFIWNLSLGFPIIEDLNGIQPGQDLQIFTGFATSF